jgi:hypothetical protein
MEHINNISTEPDNKGEKTFGEKIFYFTIVIVLFVCVALSLFLIRDNAVQKASEMAKSFPHPSNTGQIYSNQGFIYNSPGCYHGYFVSFNGSNLTIKDVLKSYRQYFLLKGWFVDPSEGDTIIGPQGEIAYDETDIYVFGNDIPGYRIEILLCDHIIDCTSVDSEFSDRTVIDNYKKEFLMTYWVVVVYKPFNVRRNPCDCCLGG